MPTYSERPVQQATILSFGASAYFESLRSATTGSYVYTGKGNRALAGVSTSTVENRFSVIQRGIYTFDTSSIPVNATITSGTLIITPTSVEKTLAGGKVGITGCSPTDPRSPAVSDYSKFSDTLLSNSLIADPTGGNLTFALNSAGLSNIVPGSDTTFMLRVHWDINGVFNGTWGSGVQHTVKGTVLDPSTPDALLVVEYVVESGVINELEGASTGVANSSGVLSKNTPLSGSVSTTTSLSGVVTKNTPLSGSVSATTSFSGVLSKHTSLSGSVSATTSFSGVLSKNTPLSGSVSTTTSFSGGVTIVLPIVAVIEPVSTASGTVLKDIRISGIVASVVNITSQISAVLSIGGTLSSVSTIAGTAGALTRQRTVTGAVVGLAGTAGALTRQRTVTGTVVGLAGTAGALTRQRTVTGVAGGSSVVSGILPVEWNLSSGIAASSTCSGDVSSGYAVGLAGTVSAVTICSGTAIRDLSLTCTVSTRAVQVSGSLARAIPVSGNISAASNFYAVLDQHSSFYGLVTTNSTIAGRLAVRSVRTAEACARPVAAALIRQVKGGREIEARVGRLSGTTQVARAQVLAATGYLQKITGIAKVSIKIAEYKRFLVIEIDLDFVTMELDLDHSVMELDLDFKVVELRS